LGIGIIKIKFLEVKFRKFLQIRTAAGNGQYIRASRLKNKKSEFEGRKFHGIKFSGKIVLQKWFFQKKSYVYLSW